MKEIISRVTADGEAVVKVGDEGEDVVIYLHPGEKIEFDLALGSLNKRIINSDLVITTLGGYTITIANYAVMLVNGDEPEIADWTGKIYEAEELYADTRAAMETSDLTPYVIDMKILSAQAEVDSGGHLNTSDIASNDIYDARKQVGDIEVSESAPVYSADVNTNLYEVRSLKQESILRNDTDIVYPFAGRTIQTQEEEDTQPVPVLFTRVGLEGLYGVTYEAEIFSQAGRDISYKFFNGGGVLPGLTNAGGGFPAVEYQYLEELVDFSKSEQSIEYRGSNDNTIFRKLQVSISGSNVEIREMRIEGIPEGVVILSTDEYEARNLGNGVYAIDTKAKGQSYNIELRYSGDMRDVTTDIIVNITAYNSRLESLVVGESTARVEFKPVDGVEDISNYNGVNYFTYSTNIDPLFIKLSDYDDYGTGGIGNHKYALQAGDDEFLSGLGNETIDMGQGEDVFHIGFGIDTVDMGAGTKDVVKFLDALGQVDTEIILDSGVVKVILDNRAGEATVINVDYLYLEDKENKIEIGSTLGFGDAEGGSKYLYLVGTGEDIATDIIQLKEVSEIYAKDGGLGLGYITTDNSDSRIYYNVGIVDGTENNPVKDIQYGYQDVVKEIEGSGGRDIIYGAVDRGVHYKGFGESVGDYGRLSGSIIYNEKGKGEVEKEEGDILIGINKIIGGEGNDIFYGGNNLNDNYAMEYRGRGTAGGVDNNTVTYEKFAGEGTEGVSIDFASEDEYIKVIRNGGIVDRLYYIQQVNASDYDDTFIMDGDVIRELDGKAGSDKIDYSQVRANIEFLLNTEYGNEGYGGTAEKLTGSDTFHKISTFVGAEQQNNTFKIEGIVTGGATFIGQAGLGIDELDYRGMKASAHIEVDFTADTNKVTIKDGGEDFIDMFSEIERIYLTENDDTFKVDSFTTIRDQDIIVDGSTSTNDIFSFENIANGGIVATDDVLTVLSQKTKNFNILKFSEQDDTFVINTGAQNNFDSIYGLGGSNEISLGFYTGVATFNIDATKANVDSELSYDINNTTNKDIDIYNFTSYRGGGGDDTFYIKGSEDHNLKIQDPGGRNIISYNGAVGGQIGNTDIDLKFELAEKRIYKNGSDSNFDSFENIAEFTGGDGNDIFILDPVHTTYKIDGAGGKNIVSYERYNVGIVNLDPSFANISVYKLTNKEDFITMGKDDNAVTIDAIGDVDTYEVDETFTGAMSYEIGVEVDMGSEKKDGVYASRDTHEDHLVNFEKLTGTDKGDTYIVNQQRYSEGFTATNELYYQGVGESAPDDNDADSVDFSRLVGDMQVDIGGIGGDGNRYVVVESNGIYVDYLESIENIMLGAGDITLVISNGNAYTSEFLKIDMGGGFNTISFSRSAESHAYILDAVGGTIDISGDIYNIANYTKIEGGSNQDRFTIEGLADYEIDGGAGKNTLDVSDVGTAVNIKLEENIVDIDNNSINFNKIEIFEIQGDQQDIKVIGIENGSYTFIGGDKATIGISEADYSGIGKNMSFVIGGGAVIGKDAITGARDKYEGNFIDIYKGGKGDDIYLINVDDTGGKAITVDGGEGKDILSMEIANTGVGVIYVFDDDPSVKKIGETNVILSFANMEIFSGTKEVDIFEIHDEYNNIFDNNGLISGDEGEDMLDASNLTSNLTLNVDINIIAYKDDESKFINLLGIEKVQLGVADDYIEIGSSANQTITEVDGGGGINYVSLANYTEEVNLELDNISIGDDELKLTNFSGYALTNYDDSIDYSGNSYGSAEVFEIDGGKGINAVSFSGLNINNDLDINLGAGVVSTVKRGNISDKLIGFSVFDINNVSKVDIEMEDLYTSYYLTADFNNEASITYANLGGGASLLMDFQDTLFVYKRDVTGTLVGTDELIGIKDITGSQESDRLILGGDHNPGSEVNVNLAQGDGVTDVVEGASGASMGIRSNAINAAGENVLEIEVSRDNITKYNLELGANNFLNVRATSEGNTLAGMLVNVTFAELGDGYKWIGGVGGLNWLDYSRDTSDIQWDLSEKTIDSGQETHEYDNFETFRGGSGDDEFMGLSDSIYYDITGNAGNNSVSYDKAVSSVDITLEANGTIKIDKIASNIQDDLTDITIFIQSSADDLLKVDVSNNNFANYSFGGGLGEDTVDLLGVGTSNVEYEIDANTNKLTIGGNELIIEGYEHIQLDGTAEFFLNEKTLRSNLRIASISNMNTFRVDTNKVGVVRYIAGNHDIAFNTSEYSLVLNDFTLYTFDNSTVDLYLDQVDFNTMETITFRGNRQVIFNEFTNLNTLDIGTDLKFNNADSTIGYDGKEIEFLGNQGGALTININSEASGYTLMFDATSDGEIVGHLTTDNSYNIDESGVVVGTTELKINNLDDYTLDLSGDATTSIKIAGSGYDMFSEIISNNNAELDLTGYRGAKGEIQIGGRDKDNRTDDAKISFNYGRETTISGVYNYKLTNTGSNIVRLGFTDETFAAVGSNSKFEFHGDGGFNDTLIVAVLPEINSTDFSYTYAQDARYSGFELKDGKITNSVYTGNDGGGKAELLMVKIENFENIDFSLSEENVGNNRQFESNEIKRGGDRLNVKYTDTYHYSTIIAPEPNTSEDSIINGINRWSAATRNSLDFSSLSNSDGKETSLFLNFEFQVPYMEGTKKVIPMLSFNLDGRYTVDDTIKPLKQLDNFTQVMGTSGDDIFKFGNVTREQISDLMDQYTDLVGENNFGWETKDRAVYDINGGGTITGQDSQGNDLVDPFDDYDTVDFSQMNIGYTKYGGKSKVSGVLYALWGKGRDDSYHLGMLSTDNVYVGRQIVSYSPILDVKNFENIKLPQGVFYVDNVRNVPENHLEVEVNNDPNSYAVSTTIAREWAGSGTGVGTDQTNNSIDYNIETGQLTGNKNIHRDLLSNSAGLSIIDTTWRSANEVDRIDYLTGFEAFQMSMSSSEHISIGSSGDLMLSNKVRMAMDGWWGYPAFKHWGGSVNMNITKSFEDQVYFTGVNTGQYYFTFGIFESPVSNVIDNDAKNIYNITNPEFDNIANNSRQVSVEYTKLFTSFNNYSYKDDDTEDRDRTDHYDKTQNSAGVTFTTLSNKDKTDNIEDTSQLGIYYGISGVDVLYATSADDTFSAGKAYFDSNYQWVSSISASLGVVAQNEFIWHFDEVNYNEGVEQRDERATQYFDRIKTTNSKESDVSKIDLGVGNDTYLDQFVNADFLRGANERAKVLVNWQVLKGSSWDTGNGGPNDTYETNRLRVVYDTNQGANANGDGLFSANYGADARSVTSNVYNNAGQGIVDGFDVYNDMANIYHGISIVNVENLIVEDTTDVKVLAMAGHGGEYDVGKDDDLYFSYDAILTGGKYDLGGRYVVSDTGPALVKDEWLRDVVDADGIVESLQNGGNFYGQKVVFDVDNLANTAIDFNWMNDYVSGADSAIVAKGPSGSTFIFENFDIFYIVGSAEKNIDVNLNFRASFDFEELDGKIFDFRIPQGDMNINFFDDYNYSTDWTRNNGMYQYTITNTDDNTEFFTIFFDELAARDRPLVEEESDSYGNEEVDYGSVVVSEEYEDNSIMEYSIEERSEEEDEDLVNGIDSIIESSEVDEGSDEGYESIASVVSEEAIQETEALDEASSMSFAMESTVSTEDDMLVSNPNEEHKKRGV